MSWTPPQCVADDGLINPDLFDVRASEMDTSTILASASALRTMAATVHDETTAMSDTWSGLSTEYKAPEQERVYALMGPAVTTAVDLKSTFDAMATHLETYASALDGIKPRLAAFETRAATFRADVIHGVTVSTLDGKGAGVGDYVVAGLRWAGGLDRQTTVVPWTEDGPSVLHNTELLEEFQGLRVEISTASAQCANDVNALREFTPLAPLSPGAPAQVAPIGPGVDQGAAMPWGQAQSEDRTCMETVAYGGLDATSAVLTGYKNFGTGVFEGATMMVLGRNPETGGMFEGDSYGQAWCGLGDLLFATVLTTSTPARLLSAFSAPGEEPNRLDEFMDAKTETATNGWGSLIGYDGANADDPWHRWKSDGVATYTESALNVATFFIPAGAAVKATSVGGKTARVVSGVADFAVPGGSWVVRTGVNAMTPGPSALHIGTGTIPRTAGLIEALDDPVVVEGRVPGDSVVSTRPDPVGHSPRSGTPYDPETSPRSTVNQSDAPRRPNRHDLQDAYSRAPVDEAGRPVDHRNGEPLRADDENGRRGTYLKWDPENQEFVAENPGNGRVEVEDPRGQLDPFAEDSGLGTRASPWIYHYENPVETFRGASEPTAADLEAVRAGQKYEVGTIEHMHARWKRYLRLHPSDAMDWDSWRKNYIQNVENPRRGKAFEDVYMGHGDASGVEWARSGSLKKEIGIDRNYDAYNVSETRALELKSGNRVDPEQIAKDREMVEVYSWYIHYVFGKQPSSATIAQLAEAGLTYEVFHAIPVPRAMP